VHCAYFDGSGQSTGRAVDLFHPKYANRKVLPMSTGLPKESSFDNGWDYLNYYDDTPQERQTRYC
jgi:hypothetical protein